MSEKEIAASIQTLNNDWVQFKAANEAALENMDSDAKVKLERINDAIEASEEKIKSLETELARENNGGADQVQAGYRSAFSNFMRTNKGIDALQDFIVSNELSVSVDSEGGVTIPEELDRAILKLAEDKSSLRPYVRAKTVGGEEYRKLVQQGGVDSGWVGEKDARPDTGTPTFLDIKPKMGEVYAQPKATQKMLDDSFFSVEALLTDEGAMEFFRKEEAAFVLGDGVDKPIGLLAAPMAYTADGVRAFGTMQKIKTGVAAGLPANADMFNWLMDIQDTLKEEHAANAMWMMHRRTKTKVRQTKDNDGNYIWEPSVKIGQPSMLLGAPCSTNTHFPTIAANALPMTFGDHRAAFTIIDRIGTRVLRDPYTQKPYVKFYMTKRVGSMHEDTEAVKVIECAV